ncbi:MAG: hypothetical protein LBM01_01130 [Christensenellaceae bacterium]|jgi:seryl-tRNA synthetase|nr:hypothetical protein [Christensenellaceae bacterium]
MAYRFKLGRHDTIVLKELCYLQKNALMIPDDAKYEEKFFEFICDNYLEQVNEFSLQIYVKFLEYFKSKENFNRIEKIFEEFKPNEVLLVWFESLKSFKKVSQRIFDTIKNKIIMKETIKTETKPKIKEIKEVKKEAKEIIKEIKKIIIEAPIEELKEIEKLIENPVEIKQPEENKVYVKKFDNGEFSIDDIADRLNAAVNFNDEN